MFVFRDFNMHYEDGLTYSVEPDRLGDFSIPNDYTKMDNCPTQIPDCDSHNPVLLDLFSFF